MNIVYLSPHFPTNFYPFSMNLNRLGAKVLGIADAPVHQLRPELQNALTDYIQVPDLHDYAQLTRAIQVFIQRHGPIDRLDSLNEYWLQTEAQLRSDFHIPGTRNHEILNIKSKAAMKQLYQSAGIPVARGHVVQSAQDCQAVVQELGYPLVAKPDIGVGAAHTWKISNEQDLIEFIHNSPDTTYILEEYVAGELYSFDGLTNREGEIVFSASHHFSQGIMETVVDDLNLSYYSLREIPADLAEAGQRVVDAFQVKEKFFHFEFFRLPDGRLVALEVNIRPPGGLTVDMMNYANDIDLFHQWAQIMVHNRFTAAYHRPYHCAYIGRKQGRNYVYSHEALMGHFATEIVHHEIMSPVFYPVMGRDGYLARSPELSRIQEIIQAIHRTH